MVLDIYPLTLQSSPAAGTCALEHLCELLEARCEHRDQEKQPERRTLIDKYDGRSGSGSA